MKTGVPMVIYISIDDTDSLESIGTGRLAREIAEILATTYPVVSVTRHQFYVHPDIPYTSHNSGAVIHLADIPKDEFPVLFGRIKRLMQERFVEGSDPGIALAAREQVSPAMIVFGFDAKTTIVTEKKARSIAHHAGIFLEGLGGTEGGVIGAVAGIGLAASGSDGRYLQIGSIREIRGDQDISDLLRTGIEQVITTEGEILTKGRVTIPKFPQPVCILGRPVLIVDERDGVFLPLRRD